MAHKLIWSPIARDDLHDIIIFIARDSPEHAINLEFAPRLWRDPEECAIGSGRVKFKY